MKNTKSFFLSLFTLLLCSSFVFSQAKSDYNKDTDFSKYKTYSFAGWQKDSDKQLTDFDKERLLKAFKAEFDARGMSSVESGADVTVTLYVVIEKKTSTTAYTDFNGGMGYHGAWGWGRGMGMGMGMGMSTATTTYSEDDYNEGTLVADMYDAGTKDMVWQGVLQAVVQDKPSKRDKTIPKHVSKLMKEYPVKPTK